MKTILTIFAYVLGAIMLLTLLPPVASVVAMLAVLLCAYIVIKIIVGAIP